MKYQQRVIGLIFGLLLMAMPLCSERYFGRVTDLRGVPLFYATVYPLSDPSEGTATNDQGLFILETEADSASIVAVSYIGYKQLQMPLMALSRDTADVTLIRLEEQPIALEETVVEAKRTRMSKRKKLAQILHLTYQKLTEDLPHDKLRYSVISDVKMNASNAPWGMEQMGADVYEAPGAGAEGKDSVQFVGRWCKRYCSPEVRERIDSVLAHEKDKNRQRMADGVDRGTLTHRALWRMRLDLDHLLDTSDELRRWKMSSEDDTRCVLTYQRKYNMLGIVKATLDVAICILSAAGMSFIGIGLQPPSPEWGAMLSDARYYIRDFAYMAFFPGMCIALTIFSLNVIGDGLRDALDPKLRD